MTNPTTPFNWQMPTASDLVTDLPADFETFGQAVATSMADLLGGTTGQILSKASNTDMDFTWITNDVGDITAVTAGTGISGGGTSGAVTITNSMATAIDAKGDLVAGTGSDAFSRLAVGSNGTVLTADSTTATGLKWAAAAGGGKVLQVVNAVHTTNVSTSSSTLADTGLSATITPTSATSKILVLVDHNGVGKINNIIGRIRLLRDSTQILFLDSLIAYTGTADENYIGAVSANYLDSPATTSATTYKTQFSATGAAFYINTASGGLGSSSTITLMEIGA